MRVYHALLLEKAPPKRTAGEQAVQDSITGRGKFPGAGNQPQQQNKTWCPKCKQHHGPKTTCDRRSK